jgi:hypothetical protein
MILGNIDQASFNPYRKLGHFSIQNNFQPSTWYLAYFPDTTSASTMSKACFPSGTQPPYSWLLAPKGGELSSTTQISGSGTLVSNQSNGINILADLDGSGDISNASLSLVTSMIAALAGVGSFEGSMVGIVQLESDLAGTGSIEGALSMLSGLSATLAGVGTLAAAMRGDMFMEADIYVNQSEATVQQIVDGVWEAVALDHDTAGTMGEKMNDAGSAGDPWSTDLDPYTTAGTAGKIVKQIKSMTAAQL